MAEVMTDKEEIYEFFKEERMIWFLKEVKDIEDTNKMKIGIQTYEFPADEDEKLREKNIRELIDRCMKEKGFIHFSK